ncbi:hypothetical protein Cob_v002011 [Colletotrichum orbiculare MAFF 240422]|uniref:Secreted protein n=1 Tax=Colletotrichum orbiculare (strain 104-T / ATCC 96160 / CBS 514.97 / LARS 414 / MAFF 240422) TaxID=1213857 RepID=A0A484G730_COLOR|nr:hypothetical protein Cob_v002011 [Colletotrichum orbiculare MAFF 240422]
MFGLVIPIAACYCCCCLLTTPLSAPCDIRKHLVSPPSRVQKQGRRNEPYRAHIAGKATAFRGPPLYSDSLTD